MTIHNQQQKQRPTKKQRRSSSASTKPTHNKKSNRRSTSSSSSTTCSLSQLPLTEIYDRAILNYNPQLLSDLESAGLIDKRFQSILTSQNNNDGDTSHAFLCATLLHRQSSPLHPSSTPTFYRHVFSHPLPPQRLDLEIERLRFASTMATSLGNTSAWEVLEEMVDVGLYEGVGRRRRELEWRLRPEVKVRWEGRKNSTVGGYLGGQVDLFLEVLKTFETNEEDVNDDDDNGNDDESSSSDENAMAIENDDNATPSSTTTPTTTTNKTRITYLLTTFQLLIDLLSQSQTRAYLPTLLLSKNLSIHSTLSPLNSSHKLFSTLLSSLMSYETTFNDNFQNMSRRSRDEIHSRSVSTLQKMIFKHHPEHMRDFYLAGVRMASKKTFLRAQLNKLSTEELMDVAYRLRLVEDKKDLDRRFLLELLVTRYKRDDDDDDMELPLPIYPTEKTLWNYDSKSTENVILSSHRHKSSSLPALLGIPKLTSHYLTYSDYLQRLFILYRLESSYAIRSDLTNALRRVNPTLVTNDDTPRTEFRGWARMSLEIQSFALKDVVRPKLGERLQRSVTARIEWDVKELGGDVKNEWESIREFDNLFLVSVDAGRASQEEMASENDDDERWGRRMGVVLVRGCMVLELRDEDDVVLNDPSSMGEPVTPKGTKRVATVALDPAQYARDLRSFGAMEMENVYSKINLVVRRQGRENNFKSVLETLRQLTSGTHEIESVLPKWFHPIVLGYDGKENGVVDTKGMAGVSQTLDFADSFLDEEHLKGSFPSETSVAMEKLPQDQQWQYKLTFVDNDTIRAKAYPKPGGYRGNPIRFTPTQIKAIRSGLSPGLTLIVGPPGTGKTDVAVQIISCLYHSYPHQKTLIVTHSNAALNDLFSKVMNRGDIDERYLLRLGSGESDLVTDSQHDFTKGGRVQHMLYRREVLLEEVQLLSEALGVSRREERGEKGEASYTCETAVYFERYHVKPAIEQFETQIKDVPNDENVYDSYPFKTPSITTPLTKTSALQKISQISSIFSELLEYRPLELLRSQRQRTDYLLTKQARIVAMTCTHAAIARQHLLNLNFQYDNILMEEAGQMLEVETFIPMLLQKQEGRLKRICMIGDHFQLPPVVKHLTVARYSNLDRSLFARLVVNGSVATVDLDKQGRSRVELAQLYNWRYKNLGDLDHVQDPPRGSAFAMANPGFLMTNQFVNVEDYQEKGESAPTSYFYQNLGEAEYIVALFQFMVLIGYPPERISILTTYNGQKQLIHDVLSQRCGRGTPLGDVIAKANNGQGVTVATVDQYQGQQNDYVLLSLVRTKSVGYMRDVRRLVVAMSRARLGLYVFGRRELFERSHEAWKMIGRLGMADGGEGDGDGLMLVRGEQYFGNRESGVGEKEEGVNNDDMMTRRMVDDEVDKKNVYCVKGVEDFGRLVHDMQEEYMKNGMGEDSSKGNDQSL